LRSFTELWWDSFSREIGIPFFVASYAPERRPMSTRRFENVLKDDFIILAASDDRLVRHDSRVAALAEAQRLASASPGKNFKVFGEVGSRYVEKRAAPPPSPEWATRFVLGDWARCRRNPSGVRSRLSSPYDPWW
jgi:hypothetical protein